MLILSLSGCSTPEIEVPEIDPPVEPPIIEKEIFRSVFNGLEIEEDSLYKAFAIMIENSPSARPHSGLS